VDVRRLANTAAGRARHRRLRPNCGASYDEVMPHPVKQVLVAVTALFAVSVWSERPSIEEPRVTSVVRYLTPNGDNTVDSDFLRLRQRTGTRLLRVGSAPDLYKDPAMREGVRLVRYPSDG